MAPINWKNERRKISEIKPAEYNPRSASEKECNDLKNSLEQFNLADPIVINQNGTIIGGHFRVRMLQEKGIDEVDVRVPDRLLTLEEEMRLNLRLNKNGGQFNPDMLANFDEDMLKEVGFDALELDKIFNEVCRGRSKTNIWRYDKPSRSDSHPTMKPVALVCEAIRNSSEREQFVLDTFLGSGTTLMACELENRACLGMELDPVYVQCAIDRWEEFTGKKAVKVTEMDRICIDSIAQHAPEASNA